MQASGRGSFEEWATARQQRLVASAYLLTGDFHRAEDLVQEALIRAATRWDQLRDGNPDAWVRTVVFRDNVSWWRRHRREVTVAATADGASYDKPGEDGLMLTEALAQLTWNQRAVLVLRFLEDLSVTQTAAVLGVSPGTVKKQTSIATRRLREIAPELGPLAEEES
ncbi:SigE family RNA polymerase sigma factor [Nocardioides sp.]|uniref:SigE family RNA polymerase sigma factor n=1 Tax=Nocardioides sp. TaxID=35761 RepID=UPI00273380CA|nr:SigE family RNA polymerase sigma factor [Nocardioides sp.]MDP3890803.1 SigE family RNA polymerase sigma factor [Nocardioides sp.]